MKKPKLIAITHPLLEEMSPEEYIAYVARISNPDNQMNHETSPRLLAFLIRQSHWSPFDMVDMTVDIETSKAIAIQLLRHWSFRFQEFSQRYAVVSNLDFSHVEIRNKAVGGNRQGSADVDSMKTDEAIMSCYESQAAYSNLIVSGAAAESARMVLPMATLSRLHMKGSVRSWMTYFWQRLDPHAQKEHRELAYGIFEIFEQNFPVIAQLLKTHKPQVVETEWL